MLLMLKKLLLIREADKMAAKIERIVLLNRLKKEIRLDWTNDRHQAIELETDDVDGLIKALEELIYLLGVEKHNNEI